MIIQFLTGIGVLLFGVSILSSGFEKLCGAKIKNAINKYSSNRFSGTLFGSVVTFTLQSSTASGILVTGLSGLGIITLFQSVCLIFGGNIGSALTMLLVAFQSINISAYFGLLALVGVFMRLLSKNETVKNLGSSLCGLGLLFTGLSLMSSATAVLKTSQGFIDFITSMSSSHILLILVGIVGTIITSSSMAMMAIITSLLGTSIATSVLSVYSAAFIVFGMNIGTCMTVLIVSATTNRKALRTAMSHLLFNVTGCILFSLLSIFDWVTPLTSWIGNPSIQIICVDIIFNVVTCGIMLSVIKPFVKLLTLIVPDKKQREQPKSQHINSGVATLAIVQIGQNATTLFVETADVLEQAMLYAISGAMVSSSGIRKQIDSTILQTDEMISSLLGLDNVSEGDKQTVSKLNTILAGIKKANINMQKLLNSCEDGEKKINFNQKQEKVMCDIQTLMIDNLQDMRFMMEEDFMGIENESLEQMTNNVLERLEKIVLQKIEAKQSVAQSSIKSSASTNKYTAYLNVINYFEQINTNLTDIIIEMLSAKNLEKPEQKELVETPAT